MSALDLGLGEQARGIASGEIDPSELLDLCLARIAERNPALNAVVETFPERSREMLAAAPNGPLRGVPVVIKDEWPLPWRAQRFGAIDALAEFAPGESGPYLALREAGAVIAGVANMHELGSSSTGNVSVYGPCHNPWDTSRCPGGSSSGPASAVAGGLVAAAVGADGLGSIRYPAAYCGLTGLKPTFGRAAMAGHHLDGSTTFIVSGPLSADAEGCRLLGSTLYGSELAAGDAKGLRIGVIRDPYWEDSTPGVREACETALEALRAETGGELVEVDLAVKELHAVAAIASDSSDVDARLTPAALNALDPELGLLNRAQLKLKAILPATIPARANLLRALIRRSFAAAFEQVDVIAWPTVPAAAPPLDNPTVELPSGLQTADFANARHGASANLTGVPGISLPVGLSEGLPVGLQLLAAWGRDELLLGCAEALERATDRVHVEARAPVPA